MRDSFANEEESFVRSFIRSLAAKRTLDLPTWVDAVLPRLRIDMHCPHLFSFCSPPFSNRRCPRFPTLFVFVAERFLTLVGSLPFALPDAPAVLFDRPLMFYWAAPSLALFFCFFLRSVPETAVSVISGFNAVAGSISRCAATATNGFLYDDRRRNLSTKEVNTIAGNSSVRDYDDIPIDFYVAWQTYVRV